MFVTVNFGRVGIYNEEISFIKSLDLLIPWFYKVT